MSYLDDGKLMLEMKLKGEHEGKSVTLLKCTIDCKHLDINGDSSGIILDNAYRGMLNNLGERLQELEVSKS